MLSLAQKIKMKNKMNAVYMTHCIAIYGAFYGEFILTRLVTEKK